MGDDQSTRVSLPRWTAPIIWLVGIGFVHGVIPWGISLIAYQHGWTEGRAGRWNLLGVIPLVAGIAGLTWILLVHLGSASEKVELELTPKYLLVRGPYRFSRNPMYVAELALWLGWAIFFGSIAVLLGLLILWATMNFIVVPREEHTLEGQFGESYRRYKNTVARWLSTPQR